MDYEVTFCGTDEQTAALCRTLDGAAARGDPIGLDTEFYGVDLRNESTPARAKLHMLSIATWRHPYQVGPRGYRISDAWVVLAPVESPPLRRHIGSHLVKAVHNLGVDAHALANAGISLNGGVNTLALARWVWPSRARGAGFTLDALGTDILGFGKTEKFAELFSETVELWRERQRKVRECECGANPCRARQSVPGHLRVDRYETTRTPYLATREVPLQTVVPGHPLWERALRYSAQDAVMALAVYELAHRAMSKQERDVPWITGTKKSSDR